MKMRATAGNGFTDVRVLMTHPMTTAQSGQPLHFIQNVTVKQNGKTCRCSARRCSRRTRARKSRNTSR
jgi:hypothetical protein